MKPDEVQAFDHFWEYVRRAEHDVRINGHRGHPPPDVIGDPWDEGFAQAYDRLKPYLRRFTGERLFVVPPGIPLRATPIKAKTGHEALMFFLNPPHELYGSVEALGSPEYLAIKEEAEKELRQRQAAGKHSSKRQRKVPAPDEADLDPDLELLLEVLVHHHIIKARKQEVKALTWREIGELLGWSQSKVSRRMAELLGAEGANGMRAYAELCRSGNLVRGFLKKHSDGRDVEAYDRDDPDDDS